MHQQINRLSMTCCLLLLPLLSWAGAASKPAQLIPQPAVFVQQDATVELTAQMQLRTDGSRDAQRVAKQFQAMLGDAWALQEPAKSMLLERSAAKMPLPAISFALNPDHAWSSPEAYTLDLDADGVRIVAGSAAGLYYGAVSLVQLLGVEPPPVRLPVLHLADTPRFSWRGILLDSARHFQSVEDIKRLLDAMAMLKLNVFHWHLTDDQGWRLDVPAWPKLTRVGGCRIPVGDAGRDATTGQVVPYCGYYSEAQIRDVVAYAAARHIDIVPEIDLPGHATAAIAAYPELGVSGQAIAVSNQSGIHTNLFNADETTMRFLEDVLTQVVRLFPGKFVHLGGDEAVKDQWRASEKMQERMRVLKVKNEAGLQAWMLERLARFLATHDRRLIGWDEILEGDVPASAAVMSWRGVEGGISAAQAGHDVVMNPTSDVYLDYLQTASAEEPPGRPKLIPMRKVYEFEPVPTALSAEQAQHVLGVQANAWTTHMRTFARVEHAIFPRIAALAEVAWSPASKRDYADFLQRLPRLLPIWQHAGIAYAQTPFQVMLDVQPAQQPGRAWLSMQQPLGYAMHYTLDGSAPTAASARYSTTLDVALPATLNVQTFLQTQAVAPVARYTLTQETLRTRRADQLDVCTRHLLLRLEDDGPRVGERATFNVDILNPCWSWPKVALHNIDSVEVRAGQIPYFFQLAAAEEARRTFLPAHTPFGEVILRDGCTGSVLASTSLPAMPAADGFVTLQMTLPAGIKQATLCIQFSGDTRPMMWVLDHVRLLSTEDLPATPSPAVRLQH